MPKIVDQRETAEYSRLIINFIKVQKRHNASYLRVQALEKALLAFHTNKMAEINKVVKELWQKTYRNRDIDCIQIKADADGAKSYAYRVVMQAGGAELEMRGRCSAGQKVSHTQNPYWHHIFPLTI